MSNVMLKFSIARWRWWILAAWLLMAGLLIRFVPPTDPAAFEAPNFLPPESPYSLAQEAFTKAFPSAGALSETVIIFERPDGPLTRPDRTAIDEIARRVTQPGPEANQETLIGVTVLKPSDILLEPNPLISPMSAQGQAALVRVNVPASFITQRSFRAVRHVRAILEHTPLPAGLRVAVTGAGGFGHDYALAAEQSHRQTLYVTLISVAVILLLVYRSPLAAMVPLIAISLAAVVAVKVLSLGTRFGLHVGTAEEIFVLVLIYGAGVDYSLLLVARFREFLRIPLPGKMAVDRGIAAALAAIVAAAATNIFGLLMLRFADYRIFKTTGPAVAIALTVAVVASLTLVPAMLAIFGKAIFWPSRQIFNRRGRVWPWVAQVVTSYPLPVLLITLAAMAYPVYRGANQTWVYDTLASIPVEYPRDIGNAAAGVETAKRHWPVGELSPVKLLIDAHDRLTPDQWRSVAAKVTAALAEKAGPNRSGPPAVADVRSLSQPLGKAVSTLKNLALQLSPAVLETYIGARGESMRLDVVLSTPPLELDTLQRVKEVREVVAFAAAQALMPFTGSYVDVHIVGATAEMIDTREVTQRDFRLVATLVLVVILLIMLSLLRQVLLSLFMLFSTVISYFATLGLCHWLLVSLPPLLGLAGFSGLDWKLEIFLFVVMVAVGQDYNIFLAGRLIQEVRRMPLHDAAREAVIHTGPVISSAGLIMAATLGSLMAGRLALLSQLGFALAMGMLIDTFIVRPLLLPTFAVLTGRKK